MSNEMPKKIWVGRHEDEGALGLGTLHVPRFMADFPELTEYTRTDTILPEAQKSLEFLKRAAKENCRIVSSGDLTIHQIAEARVQKRFFVDEWGFGYALLPWDLTTTKDEERANDKKTDVAELQRQNAALKTFVKEVVDIAIQSQAHSITILGAEIEDIAKKLTIIEGEQEGKFADWMLTDTAMPAPSKAEVAREFLSAVTEETLRLKMTLRDARVDMSNIPSIAELNVIKEWEDAESK